MIVLLGNYDWNIGNCFGCDSLRPEIGLKTFYALASVFIISLLFSISFLRFRQGEFV